MERERSRIAGGKWNYGRPSVIATSVDRNVLEWARERWGGSLIAKRTYKEHHSPSYAWSVTGTRAIRLLEAILPYLLIERKRQRATLLIERYEAATPRNGWYTHEMKAAKTQLVRDVLAIK